MKRFFVSTSIYALAHQLGMQGAVDEFRRQLDYPGPDSLPVVRTISRLRQIIEVGLHVDGGATYIGMARSRAFHEAFKSGLPWISLDDDIEVTMDVVTSMVEALDDVLPRIVFVPYYMRDGADQPKLTTTLPEVRVERSIGPAKLVLMPKGRGGGFGMVGMNRPAIEAVVALASTPEWWPFTRWLDDGAPKLALFQEALVDGLWWGEDTNFFRTRVPESVTVEALLVGTVLHGGFPLQLGTL